ncbi:DNA polymerase beta subunit [Caballeronia calidae]|uniref:DNA polymerase beta subunit n=1 Tax=Caballeronia calidae TaxID=1777139 RepID=A0A158EL09_9BURK|nr:DNA polymerase beta subunit [Caballeronia calidae]
MCAQYLTIVSKRNTPENFVKPSIALNAHRAEIRRIVEDNRATNARVFGSVLHGEDTEESDLDLLVEPEPGMTLLNLGAIRYKLADLLGVHVDVLTPNALPDKVKAIVMAEAQPV